MKNDLLFVVTNRPSMITNESISILNNAQVRINTKKRNDITGHEQRQFPAYLMAGSSRNAGSGSSRIFKDQELVTTKPLVV